MKYKKQIVTCMLVLALAGMMTACGQKPTVEAPSETNVEEPAAIPPAAPEDTVELPETEEAPDPDEIVEALETEEVPEIAEEAPAKTFEDNFSVDSESAEAFAEKIQTVTAEQDLEALAALTAYPIYIGFADGGVSVNDAQEMIDLGAARIFTAELMESVKNAQTAELSPSKAGFSLSENGGPNVIFGVRDGVLAVQGINY